jgi:ferredoxin
MALKISVDKNKCIGCGTCATTAPNTFELDEGGKSKVKNPDGDEQKTILEAAKGCPVGAIIVKDEKGKRLFPET